MLQKLALPEQQNSYYDFTKRYDLHPKLVFTYGSNIAGIHGAGAARDALWHYGAKVGIGSGLQGRSYAIPTKNRYIKTMSLKDIAPYVEAFVKETQKLDKYYFVTAVGTGLARIPHEGMASLFKGCKNCWLPDIWKPYLESKECIKE